MLQVSVNHSGHSLCDDCTCMEAFDISKLFRFYTYGFVNVQCIINLCNTLWIQRSYLALTNSVGFAQVCPNKETEDVELV